MSFTVAYTTLSSPKISYLKSFASKWLSQDSIEQDNLLKNILTKTLILVLNHLKNKQLVTCYSSLQLILFKVSTRIPLRMKDYHRNSLFTMSADFSALWFILSVRRGVVASFFRKH